jgi:enoyl-CoA hydratase
MFLGLTGMRLKAADSLYAGIATDFVPTSRWDTLLEALSDGTAPDTAIAGLKDRVPDTFLLEHRSTIDRIFAAGSVEEVLTGLDTEHEDWTDDIARTIRTKSPTSLKVTFRQIREGKKLDFEDCMKMEYRMVNRIVAGHDFYEGVRAVIIDKDNAPKWRPAELSAVSQADVDAYFAPLKDKELKL